MKFKFTRSKSLAAVMIVAILVLAFWYGGNAPGLQGFNTTKHSDVQQQADTKDDMNSNSKESQKTGDVNKSDELQKTEEAQKADEEKKDENILCEEKVSKEATKAEKKPAPDLKSRPGGTEGNLSADEKIELAKKLSGNSSSLGVQKGSKSYSESQGMVIDAATGKDKYMTDPVPEGKPVPVEPQDVEISDIEHTCTLSVRCDTILNNMDWLDPEKVELVPRDGVIYATKTVKFYEGESVFNVLQREMKKSKIHMEFSNTPIYNSVYIEGINNLYEFDCGELSGWMYKVNSWFPNYGCSRYQLKEGDVIEWVYTCNLGIDVGGYYSVGS